VTQAQVTALRRAAETPETGGAEHMSAVARDLSAAFATYPMFLWFMRDDARRDTARLRFFEMLMRRLPPGGMVLRPAMGGAASVWTPSEALGPTSPWQELRILPTLLEATGLARFGRLAAMRAAMDRHHPMDRPHSYLWLLGVRPGVQGLGIGSRLLAAGLRRTDAQGLPVFLETSTCENVALYRRHGFEVISEYLVRADSPPSWAMWREPQLEPRPRVQ